MKIRKTFRIEEKIARQLQDEADQKGLDFSSMVRTLIYQHINNYEIKTVIK